MKCKNSDHIRLFHCINIHQVPWKKFEHLAKAKYSNIFFMTQQNVNAEKKCM